jgi:hypothetical protein
MKRDNFLEALGFVYLANHRTKEVHRVSHLHVNCRVGVMTNVGYCTWLWHWVLILLFGYNGCRWCCPERDKG